MIPASKMESSILSNDNPTASSANVRLIKKRYALPNCKRDYDGAISLVDAVLIPRTSLQEVSFVQMKSSATLMRLRRKKRAKFKKVG